MDEADKTNKTLAICITVALLFVALFTGVYSWSSNAQMAACSKLHMPETINGVIVQGSWPNGTSYVTVGRQTIMGAWVESSGTYPNGTTWSTITMFGLSAEAPC